MDYFLGTQEEVRNSRGKRAISVRAIEVLLYAHLISYDIDRETHFPVFKITRELDTEITQHSLKYLQKNFSVKQMVRIFYVTLFSRLNILSNSNLFTCIYFFHPVYTSLICLLLLLFLTSRASLCVEMHNFVSI